MALKAGYQGLKKAFKQSIESFMASMSDALIIKSLDDALSLSDDGELSVDDASTSGKGIVQLDAEPTEDSGNAITSGGVYAALQDVSSYAKDLLYGSETITHPPAQLADYTLAHDIKDYDVIRVIAGFTSNNVDCIESWECPADILDTLPTATADTNKQFAFPVNAGGTGSGQWLRLSKGSADNIIHVRYNDAAGIYQIYGIKF